MFGTLIPIGGGDPIPLPDPKSKKQLLIGRRESCDIVLRFANVSAHHCQLFVDSGYWYVRDMQSSNGVKINDVKMEKGSTARIDPGNILAVAKHKYRVDYDPIDLGAVGPPPPADNRAEEIMGQSLLSRAGLNHREFNRATKGRDPDERKRFDVNNMQAGQIELPDDPV